MLQDITQIQKLRKQFGLTQGELARRSGVSQSLIAKVESGFLDPSYTNAQKIFSVLEELGNRNILRARDVMSKRIIYANPDDPIQKITKKIRLYEISQMPVLSGGVCIGRISDQIILNALVDKKNAEVVSDIMESAPPSVTPDTPLEAIASLLKHFKFVLVIENGKMKGVVSKFDIIENLR